MITFKEFISGMEIASDISIVLTDVMNGGEDGMLEYAVKNSEDKDRYLRVTVESISKEEYEREEQQTEGEQDEMHKP